MRTWLGATLLGTVVATAVEASPTLADCDAADHATVLEAAPDMPLPEARSVVPAAKERCHLPFFVDPSHATGLRSRVPAMALAAVAAGADGIMVEVHPAPERALSDGPEALLPEQFGALVGDLRALSAALGRRMEPVR